MVYVSVAYRSYNILLTSRLRHYSNTQRTFLSRCKRFYIVNGWLGSRVVSVMDSGAEARVQIAVATLSGITVLGKLYTPVVPLFTKQQNW